MVKNLFHFWHPIIVNKINQDINMTKFNHVEVREGHAHRHTQ
jgi:hypothetical protein